MYKRVLGLALAMTNATLRGDVRAHRAALRELRDYHGEHDAEGGAHPFLSETLADYTPSRAAAVKLYHRALRLSRRMGEPQHTILLSLGKLYLDAGNVQAARRNLRAAHREAVRVRDRELSAEARELLEKVHARSTA